MYPAWYGHLDNVVSDLEASGVTFAVVHGDKGIGGGLGSESPDEIDAALERLERNCRTAAALGAKTLVLHL